MKNDFDLNLSFFALHQLSQKDASLVISLRNSKNANYIPSIDSNIEKQEKWISNALLDNSQLNFKIYNKILKKIEGIVSIYNIDKNSAEWGRWVLYPESFAAFSSAWLIYEFGFTRTNINFMYCNTLTQNTKVINFHNSFGLSSHKNGLFTQHILKKKKWNLIKNYNLKKIQLLENRLKKKWIK